MLRRSTRSNNQLNEDVEEDLLLNNSENDTNVDKKLSVRLNKKKTLLKPVC